MYHGDMNVPANVTGVAEAVALALGLGALTKQMPSIQTDATGHVRIYWTSEQLPAVQAWFNGLMSAPGGYLTVDLLPVVYPWLVPKLLPWVALSVFAVYWLGRKKVLG
jgi:hypothetical protein